MDLLQLILGTAEEMNESVRRQAFVTGAASRLTLLASPHARAVLVLVARGQWRCWDKQRRNCLSLILRCVMMSVARWAGCRCMALSVLRWMLSLPPAFACLHWSVCEFCLPLQRLGA